MGNIPNISATEVANRNAVNTATAKATLNTESNEQQSTTSRRRSPSAPIWTCMTMARKMFNNLPASLQNNQAKQLCLDDAARRTYSDSKRVRYEIRNEAARLTNLKDFEEHCAKNGVDANIAAQHVVFEGKTVMRRVMEYGVASVLGTKIELFSEPLVVDSTAPITETPAASKPSAV